MEHVAAPWSAARVHPAGHQLDHLVELLSGQLGVRLGSAHELVEVVGSPLLGPDLGDHLLGEDVEGQSGELDGVEAAGPHRREQGRALHQLIAGQRVEPPLGHADA